MDYSKPTLPPPVQITYVGRLGGYSVIGGGGGEDCCGGGLAVGGGEDESGGAGARGVDGNVTCSLISAGVTC